MSYDIFHLSYKEAYAEETYQNLKKNFPWARRVKGVKGIFNAHQQCSQQAYTEMFYVVDADADLDSSFDFMYKPTKWDRDKIHVWRCRNPVNDLIYGYGGVKLFPTQTVRKATDWNIDFTSSVGGASKFKPMPPVSNTTRFNTDPFNTWKSAFRECTKLASKIIENQKNDETDARLDVWCEKGLEAEYGKYCIAGAKAGRQYGLTNRNNPVMLNNINDFDWLKETFDADTRTIG